MILSGIITNFQLPILTPRSTVVFAKCRCIALHFSVFPSGMVQQNLFYHTWNLDCESYTWNLFTMEPRATKGKGRYWEYHSNESKSCSDFKELWLIWNAWYYANRISLCFYKYWEDRTRVFILIISFSLREHELSLLLAICQVELVKEFYLCYFLCMHELQTFLWHSDLISPAHCSQAVDNVQTGWMLS